MTERAIEIAEGPARLSARNDLLVLARDGEAEVTVPFCEISTVVVAHPRVSFTHATLAGLATHRVSFVVCDDRFLPVGLLLPLQSHFLQAERFARQAAASRPRRKRIWQSIVRAKIRAQGALLAERLGSDHGLVAMQRRVRSGDPGNVEAEAARRYWNVVFGAPPFRRNRGAEDLNSHLNYGYAVLRAVTARAICAAGLHPSLGVQHHNRYDAFCLADDLMEPYRPIVDRLVGRVADERGRDVPLDREARSTLLSGVLARYEVEGEVRTLFDILQRAATSLAATFTGEREAFSLPEVHRVAPAA